MSTNFIALAGTTGALGSLIAKELRKRGASVKGLVRAGTSASRTEALSAAGVNIVPVDLSDIPSLTRELEGATCVVSALQGLKDVIHTAQGSLLDAAVAAKVPRFIPSDFSLDFTKTKPGSNRNLDLRREFHPRLEDSGIAWTSILIGEFMDLLISDVSPINTKSHKVMYAGSPTQALDYTTMQDTAAYTAAVAVDTNPTPKILRIAGDVATTHEVVQAASEAEGVDFKPMWTGSVWFLEYASSFMQFFGGQNQVMPMFQVVQYIANMASGLGKLEPLDNDRYPDLKWTKIVDILREAKATREAPSS